MPKKRKRTPEEREEFARWERQTRENLRRLWDYLDQAWTELEESRRREGRPLRMARPERPIWAGPED
jgi:hypothetical protein